MKLKTVVMVAVLAACVSVAGIAQTGADVVDRHVEAIGGKAKLQAIDTYKATGVFKMPAMNFEMEFTRVSARPKKMRMDMTSQMGNMIQATDGEVVWGINPFMGQTEPTLMEGTQADQILSQAGVDGFLINREEQGISLEYLGEEDRGGIKLDKVKVTMGDGTAFDAYFDKSTGILVQVVSTYEQAGQTYESVQQFSDYRETEGILSAHRIDQTAGGQEMVIIINEIVYNEPVDATIFEMPAK